MTIPNQHEWGELRARLQEINDLMSVAELLGWDQFTYMPPAASAARGRQLATVGRLAHEKLRDPAIGRLLDLLEPTLLQNAYESDEAALLRVTRRKFERATCVPPSFTARLAEHQTAIYEAWAAARPANAFADVQPLLEKTLDYSREFATFFPGAAHVADPLIDGSDYGMSVATLRPLFAELRAALTPMVKQITEQPAANAALLHQYFDEARQISFGEEIIRAFGFDFERGRQDRTLHPFCSRFSRTDVRITTRVYLDDLSQALFSTLHEAGHALYEQGVSPALEGTPLDEGTSAGVHESQSRLWENIVGRSLPFWRHYYPQLQATFPDQLSGVLLDAFYRAINKVQRSLIRTDADEVTYNLHVVIRFELELQLLEGALTVAELPAAWRAAYAETLGITPPDDRDGVLQDVHWFSGLIGGAFQGYAIGNILSAQFFDAAVRAHPQIPAEIGAGKFDTLHGWLVEQIYRHGAKFTTTELVERATGGPLSLAPYLAYLRTKYGALYQLTDLS
jgi:carboxypeptidase Taq